MKHSHTPPMREGHMFVVRQRAHFAFIMMGKNLEKRREVQIAMIVHIPTPIQDSDDEGRKGATDN